MLLRAIYNFHVLLTTGEAASFHSERERERKIEKERERERERKEAGRGSVPSMYFTISLVFLLQAIYNFPFLLGTGEGNFKFSIRLSAQSFHINTSYVPRMGLRIGKI